MPCWRCRASPGAEGHPQDAGEQHCQGDQADDRTQDGPEDKPPEGKRQRRDERVYEAEEA